MKAKKQFVFVLQHVRSIEGCDDIKLLGIFSNRIAALAAKKKLGTKPGFRKFQKGFYLDMYEVDFLHWDKGFRTL